MELTTQQKADLVFENSQQVFNGKIAFDLTTPQGVTVRWEIGYSLGGMNYFTGRNDPRGYSIHVSRSAHEFVAFTGLEDPAGAIRAFVLEVGRKSNKKQSEAMELGAPIVFDALVDAGLWY